MHDIVIMNLYSISGGRGLIGVNHGNKHYVVSFKQEKTAQRVKNSVHFEPRLYLERSIIEDVSFEVNTALETIGIKSDVDEIMVDTAAKLTVMKNKDTWLETPPDESEELEIVPVPYESFFLYPFENNLGIILQHDLYSEDSDKFVFLCSVVDPCGIYLKDMSTML